VATKISFPFDLFSIGGGDAINIKFFVHGGGPMTEQDIGITCGSACNRGLSDHAGLGVFSPSRMDVLGLDRKAGEVISTDPRKLAGV